jgi:amidohydrolase
MRDLTDQANQLLNKSIEMRRHLHQFPELSLKESATSEYCKKQLHALGYNIKESWGYGFTADLDVNPSFSKVALRADMDALPIQEKNTHNYVSKQDHVAHMCGHDSHMSIALTAAELIMNNREHLKYNVRFLFQPCEEMPPGGALGMIEKGCLDGVDEVYGLHNYPNLEVGEIATRTGGFLAAADAFDMHIIGRGGHAARPHDCLDPVYVAALLITQWQTLISRKIDPAHCAVLSVTQCIAGDTFNVIPDSAKLAGTVRTFDETDRQRVITLMEQSTQAFKEQGYRFEFNYTRGYDSVVNHASGVARVSAAAAPILTAESINTTCSPYGFGEDFAYYLQHCPGAFFLLGSGNRAKGISEPLHASTFDIDERCLSVGAAIMAQLVL